MVNGKDERSFTLVALLTSKVPCELRILIRRSSFSSSSLSLSRLSLKLVA